MNLCIAFNTKQGTEAPYPAKLDGIPASLTCPLNDHRLFLTELVPPSLLNHESIAPQGPV